MSRLIGYVRVSTDDQADKGGSIPAQRSALQGYCAAHGHELVDVVTDAGVSAATLERPGLRGVLARIGAGEADGVLVAKLDRLTRSLRDLHSLIDRGAGDAYELHSIGDHIDTTSATGRLMLDLIVRISQWERERIGERISEVLQDKRARGQSLGRVPFGWRREAGRLAPLEDEQRVVAGVHERRRAGASLESIALELNESGVAGRLNGRWTATAVRRVLSRKPASEAA